MSNVVKFPYDACRRVHSRKPRRSKNGKPEERAVKETKTAAALPPATVTQLPRPRTAMLDQEFKAALEELDESGRQFINGYMQALLDQRGCDEGRSNEGRANFKDEMRRRIDMIAADYGVPQSEVAKVKGRLKHYDVLCFTEKYRISLDWLICGDLKGACSNDRREANMKRWRRYHRTRNRQPLAAHARRLRR